MEALRVLWHIEGWLLFFAPFLMLAFAINRGTLHRRINYNAITASFFTASLLVFAYLTNSLDDIVNFSLVDGDQTLLVRTGVFSIFSLTGAIVITYQLGEDTLDAIYHGFMIVSAQVTWFLAAKSVDHVFFWSYQAISSAMLLFLHIIMESRNGECLNSSYGNSLLLVFFLYVFVFFLFTALGPWFLGEISLVAQESVLVVVDIFYFFYFSCGISHYGGEALNANKLGLRPGCTNNKTPKQIEKLADIIRSN